MLESFGLKTKKEEYTQDYKEKIDIFKVMYSALNKNYTPTKKEVQKIPEFLFHNILSNNEALLEIALFFTIYNIPIEIQYKLISNLPKVYIPYPKKSKKQEEIEILMKYYNCNENTAKKYLDLLTDKQFKEIKEKFKIKEKIKGAT